MPSFSDHGFVTFEENSDGSVNVKVRKGRETGSQLVAEYSGVDKGSVSDKRKKGDEPVEVSGNHLIAKVEIFPA